MYIIYVIYHLTIKATYTIGIHLLYLCRIQNRNDVQEITPSPISVKDGDIGKLMLLL